MRAANATGHFITHDVAHVANESIQHNQVISDVSNVAYWGYHHVTQPGIDAFAHALHIPRINSVTRDAMEFMRPKTPLDAVLTVVPVRIPGVGMAIRGASRASGAALRALTGRGVARATETGAARAEANMVEHAGTHAVTTTEDVAERAAENVAENVGDGVAERAGGDVAEDAAERAESDLLQTEHERTMERFRKVNAEREAELAARRARLKYHGAEVGLSHILIGQGVGLLANFDQPQGPQDPQEPRDPDEPGVIIVYDLEDDGYDGQTLQPGTSLYLLLGGPLLLYLAYRGYRRLRA